MSNIPLPNYQAVSAWFYDDQKLDEWLLALLAMELDHIPHVGETVSIELPGHPTYEGIVTEVSHSFEWSEGDDDILHGVSITLRRT